MSYMALIAAQSRPHSRVYQSKARHFDSAADILASSREVSARLRGPAPVVPPHPEMPEEPFADESELLNMLAPCSWRFLVKLAALRHAMSARDVVSRSRKLHIVAARTEALCLIYRHTQHSMPSVGRLFGLNHATVSHALNKTGTTAKLVELLPTADAATRPRAKTKAVIGVVEPTPIPVPAAKPANAVQRVVRAGYRAGKPRDEIAAAAGIKPKSVKVIAHRMGLRRSDFAPSSVEAAQ